MSVPVVMYGGLYGLLASVISGGDELYCSIFAPATLAGLTVTYAGVDGACLLEYATNAAADPADSEEAVEGGDTG